DPSLVKLKELMDRPGSPPGPVAIHARNVLSVLDQRMLLLGSSKTMSPADVRGLLGALAGNGVKRAGDLDWDESAQYYLGLAALNQALSASDPKNRGEEAKRALGAPGERLKTPSPPGLDSPRRFDPLAAPTLEAQFKTIRNQLGN